MGVKYDKFGLKRKWWLKTDPRAPDRFRANVMVKSKFHSAFK